MADVKTASKKQNWRFSSLKNLKAAPRGFLCHPAPRDIGSYTRGEQMLAGHYEFAGQLAASGAATIWNLKPPSASYFAALHSFGWLADLAAIGDKAAREQAQKWLLEWIEAFGQGAKTGWEPGLAGARVVHWCTHAMFLLKGLPPKSSAKVFKNLGRHVNFLLHNQKAFPDGAEKFEALSGLIYAGVALEGCENALRPALADLAKACQSEVGPDGAILTRNPEELAQIFTLLTSVVQLLKSTGHHTEPEIESALVRLTPGLRCLRFGNGGLARFHGGGRGIESRLDQALADAGIKKTAGLNRFMGYERLSAGRIVAIIDAAAPPASPNAHASALGFEMYAGRVPIVVNCGSGTRLGGVWRGACAQAAAHNTLTVAGQGPQAAMVTSERAKDHEAAWLSATSRGFAKPFGLLHERRLLVASSGRMLSGEDNIFPEEPAIADEHPASTIYRPEKGHSFMLHFHLHPDIAAVQKGHSITLTLPEGGQWVFHQEGGIVRLEASVMLDRTHISPRATKQIVVAGRSIDYVGAIRWSFTRL